MQPFNKCSLDSAAFVQAKGAKQHLRCLLGKVPGRPSAAGVCKSQRPKVIMQPGARSLGASCRTAALNRLLLRALDSECISHHLDVGHMLHVGVMQKYWLFAMAGLHSRQSAADQAYHCYAQGSKRAQPCYPQPWRKGAEIPFMCSCQEDHVSRERAAKLLPCM